MIFEAISSEEDVASYVTDDEEESGQKASEDMAVEMKRHLLLNIN